MGPGRMQAGLLQFLPMLGVICATWTASVSAQESFPNELNSPVDEPQVIVREHHDKVPVRQASRGVQESQDPLVKLAWETREATRRRLLSTAQHTPWQMMHGLLGLRQDFLITHNGEAVNGLEWIKAGQTYQNEPWFEKTQHGGRAHPYNKPYWFEGHINQSLAILSQCEVPLDTTFGTPKGPITMRDMLKNAQMTVNEKEEVTWTLWALCTYLPPDAKWVNARGEQWSIERLVQVEVGKPVGGPTSPCGGTHGLYALARARNIYMATGKPLRGVWYQADQKIKKYIQISRVNQNANGTLSSAFFKGKEFKQDFDKRMASTGHQLEFLMMALDERQLKEPWVRRAVEATANDLMSNRKEYVSCSPLYHATNALTLFLERTVPSERQQNVAQRPPAKTISNSKELASTGPTTNGPGSVPPVPKTAVIGPATVQNVTPSATQPAPGSSTTTTGSTAVAQIPGKDTPKTPEIAPALKQTPPADAVAVNGKDVPKTIAGTNAAKGDPTTPVVPDSSDSPLQPVPLPDLTIPVPEAKKPVLGDASIVSSPSIPIVPGSTATSVEIAPAPEMPAATNSDPSTGGSANSDAIVASVSKGEPSSAAPTIDVKLPMTNDKLKTAEVIPVPLVVPTTPSEELTIPVQTPSVPIELPANSQEADPVVSAERPEHAGPSEAVAPLIAPVPLRKVPAASTGDKNQSQPAIAPSMPSQSTIPIQSVSQSRPLLLSVSPTPAKQLPTENSSGTTPINPVPGTSVTSSVTSPGKPQVGPQPASSPPTVPATQPQSPSGEMPPALPAEKQQQPTEKPRWKATPADRRKAFSQNDKKRLR